MLLFVKVLLCAWLVQDNGVKVLGRVEPLNQLPADLQWYLDTCRSTGDLTYQTGKLVFWTSINQYISKFVKSRQDLTPDQARFLQTNLYEALYPVYAADSAPGGRNRRQIIGGPRRVRREIRVLSLDERRRYYAAINAMKADTSLPPNVYDFIAAYHQGDNIQRAHFGPAFPGWHRLYLWIFEHFLRLQDSTLSVPYWASVFDNDMQDPTQSVLWSPGFYGNGVGAPTTGPFRNWPQINPQTSFTRNVQGGQLYTYDGIQRILSRRRNSEILIPTAFANSNHEIQHGAPHVFVGGSMNNLNAAARDPIFFSHHSFVDQIWERFRQNQRRNGINPQQDYPFDSTDPRFSAAHDPDANAGFTGLNVTQNWTQQLGYRNVFSNLVEYEDVPSCPSCANSPYLFCNNNLNPPRCVSRTSAEMSGTFYVDEIVTAPTRSNPQSATLSEQSGTSMNFPSNSSTSSCPKKSIVNDVPTLSYSDVYGIPKDSHAYDWAYIPVKVISKRPLEYHDFQQYSMYNHTPRHHRGPKAKLLKTGLQEHYQSCEKIQDAVGKISVVAYGLNYDGYAEEYILLDNRLGVSEGNAYVPVRKPVGTHYSDVILAAFDSCGRACKPYYSMQPSTGQVSDVCFSGGIRVTSDEPLEYGQSYAEAIYDTWDVPSYTSCPKMHHVPISFFCEYTNTWVWNATCWRPSDTHPHTKPSGSFRHSPNVQESSSSGYDRPSHRDYVKKYSSNDSVYGGVVGDYSSNTAEGNVNPSTSHDSSSSHIGLFKDQRYISQDGRSGHETRSSNSSNDSVYGGVVGDYSSNTAAGYVNPSTSHDSSSSHIGSFKDQRYISQDGRSGHDTRRYSGSASSGAAAGNYGSGNNYATEGQGEGNGYHRSHPGSRSGQPQREVYNASSNEDYGRLVDY